jgi:hypothetical protein
MILVTATNICNENISIRNGLTLRNKLSCQSTFGTLLILTTFYFNFKIDKYLISQSSLLDSNLQLDDAKSKASWEWRRFRQVQDSSVNSTRDNSTIHKAPSKNYVLIGQYDSGVDSMYSTLLNISSRVNIEYAKKYEFDYVAIRGITFTTPLDKTLRIPQPSRATYSKLTLLERALDYQYEYLFVLDSDALVYDFTRDISQLISADKMILAHQVESFEKKQYHNINIGMILFNLRHPTMRGFLGVWKMLCAHQIMAGIFDDDQTMMQYLVDVLGAEQLVEKNYKDLSYHYGDFAHHFVRNNASSWTDSDSMEKRIQTIQAAATEVCNKYHLDCLASL